MVKLIAWFPGLNNVTGSHCARSLVSFMNEKLKLFVVFLAVCMKLIGTGIVT